jgi:hypothetical protein
VHGCISHQSHKDTQDSASLAPSLGTLPFPTRETSPSNCYLELAVTKKETKLLPSITDGRLGYLGINEDKMRFWDAENRGKALGGNGGHDTINQ